MEGRGASDLDSSRLLGCEDLRMVVGRDGPSPDVGNAVVVSWAGISGSAVVAIHCLCCLI